MIKTVRLNLTVFAIIVNEYLQILPLLKYFK
jgi:hypothetical protein